MRTTEEFVAEAQRRAVIILERRRRRRNIIFTAAAIVFSIAVIVGGAYAMVRYGPPGPRFGSLILTGILAMMSGAALTLICQRYKQKSEREPRNAEPNKEDFGL